MATTTFTADCPECHEQCGWCSMYRWIVRKEGCMAQFAKSKRNCRLAAEVKGKPCGTCDGSRKVRVTQTVEKLSASGAIAQEPRT